MTDIAFFDAKPYDIKSFDEANKYAEKNNLVSLTMKYDDFIKAFNSKIEKFKSHVKYTELLEQSKQAKIYNTMSGYNSIVAHDFIKRIITMPAKYIEDWLEEKNNLEWLAEYK